MGTGRSGRFLSKAGSARHVSEYALIHSNEGTFSHKLVRGQKNMDGSQKYKIRLASGGHGQAGMDLLDKYGIEYHVVKTFKNGVRVGYVPDHRSSHKRIPPNQSWFPSNWTEKDIKHAGEHVAGLKKNRRSRDGTTMVGKWKGVTVGVIKTNGKIATVFPLSKQ